MAENDMDFGSIKDKIEKDVKGDDEESGETSFSIERVPTGVEGLDESMEGGIPDENLVLVAGGPGTGKTTLCVQFLLDGLEEDETALYVSLDESEEKIIRNAMLFGWDLQEYIEEDRLRIIHPHLGDYKKVKSGITHAAQTLDVDRVVIDSLTVIGSYFENMLKLRMKIMDLNSTLSQMNATVMATSEIPDGEDGISRYGVEEFAVDGIIRMYYVKRDNSFQRGFTIRKMRGTDHSTDIHPIKISKGGITAYTNQKMFENVE